MLKCYAEMLPELHAERQLAAIEAASVPYMEKTAGQAVMRRYSQLVGKTKKAARTLGEALAGVPMRRIEVPKDEGVTGG